ncbi:hypothetical protein B0C18_004562 [Salmonella enterica]|nr:hypothetical protein [Salmonella enterica]
MSIKKRPDGKWLVDIRPDGRNGKRVRRVCVTRREAEEFERQLTEHVKVSHQFAVKLDRRHLSELCEIWWGLVDHEKNNIEKRNIEKTVRQMKDPMVYVINDDFIIEFIRLRAVIFGIRKTSILRDVYRLSGMFTKLINKGECEINPLKNIGLLIKRIHFGAWGGSMLVLPPNHHSLK